MFSKRFQLRYTVCDPLLYVTLLELQVLNRISIQILKFEFKAVLQCYFTFRTRFLTKLQDVIELLLSDWIGFSLSSLLQLDVSYNSGKVVGS